MNGSLFSFQLSYSHIFHQREPWIKDGLRGPDGEGNLICVGTTRCQPTDLSVGQNLAEFFLLFFYAKC